MGSMEDVSVVTTLDVPDGFMRRWLRRHVGMGSEVGDGLTGTWPRRHHLEGLNGFTESWLRHHVERGFAVSEAYDGFAR